MTDVYTESGVPYRSNTCRQQLTGLALAAGMPEDLVAGLPDTTEALYTRLFCWHAARVLPELLQLAQMSTDESGALCVALRHASGTWHVKVILELASQDGRGFGPYREPGVYELTTDVDGIHGHASNASQSLLAIWTHVLTTMIRLAAGFKAPDAAFTE